VWREFGNSRDPFAFDFFLPATTAKSSIEAKENMGDKSAKDKGKSQKQKTDKQDQKAKVTQDRNRKKPQ
jgi:hypothetical protein